MDTPKEATPSATIWLKVCVAVLPSILVPRFNPPHEHLLFSLSLVAGVLLQALIPPRKKGLVLVLVLTSITAVVYFLILS